jgi:hypothetical protein
VDVTTSAPGGNGIDYLLAVTPTQTELQNGTSSRGMTWNAIVDPPTGCPVAFGSGSLIIVQVINSLDRSYSTIGGTRMDPDEGHTGLDTNYPYGWVDGAPAYMSGDSLSIDLTAYDAIAATQNLTFEDYLMYFAPGSNQCVSLGHYTWTTSANVSSHNWSTFPNPAGTVTDSNKTGTFLQSNEFPSWTEVITSQL